jgi:ATP synthase protein I
MNQRNNKEKKEFSQKIAEKEKQKLKSLLNGKRSTLSGLGLFGIVGWSVVVPTLLGIAAGIWLDKKYPQSFSWTISLLFVGLFLGCLIAWQWVDKENKKMHQNKDKDE